MATMHPMTFDVSLNRLPRWEIDHDRGIGQWIYRFVASDQRTLDFHQSLLEAHTTEEQRAALVQDEKPAPEALLVSLIGLLCNSAERYGLFLRVEWNGRVKMVDRLNGKERV